ncbi:P-loop NTPase fold protein [Candidatus Albibeggiatoa sp. nov. BB20]|uniref:P-loop NTPase fold protein n=1 Tax=Candidatus Albibeggiatoa sp. nov. BB20 TaxID=3162723 RepID=UPI00336572D5
MKKFLSQRSFQDVLGIQAEIFKELRLLLEAWIPDPKNSKKRILLIIDDIDRCSENKIIEIIDALRVMLDDDEIHKRLVIIACIDEIILERAIYLKYSHLAQHSEKSADMDKLITEYIDKLFLIAIKLPELTEAEKEELFRIYSDSKCSHPLPTTKKAKGRNKSISSKTSEQQENVYDIDGNEQKNLIRSLKCIKNVTPRKIRIFYYRYLLARRLAHIFTMNNKEKFGSPDYNKYVRPLLISLIINKTEQYRVTIKPKQQIKPELYQFLIKIIDIVVAY